MPLHLSLPFGFPDMNSMQQRIGVKFVENSTGSLSMSSSSRDKNDSKANLTINVTAIGDDHLLALEEAGIEQQQALLPFIQGQRPFHELVAADNEIMDTELHIVALQQYLDTTSAYSEVLQLEGRVDFALNCIRTCSEAVDLFIAKHILPSLSKAVSVSEIPLDASITNADFLASVDRILFVPVYLERVDRAGIAQWLRVANHFRSMTKPLSDFLKRIA